VKTIDIIFKVIKEIQAQKSIRAVDLDENKRVIEDLGFVSLDIAQLIAILELEIGVDPFSEGVALTDVSTIGELNQVYQTSIDQKSSNGDQE